MSTKNPVSSAQMVEEIRAEAAKITDPVKRSHALKDAAGHFRGEELELLINDARAALDEFQPKGDQERGDKVRMMGQLQPLIRRTEEERAAKRQ